MCLMPWCMSIAAMLPLHAAHVHGRCLQRLFLCARGEGHALAARFACVYICVCVCGNIDFISIKSVSRVVPGVADSRPGTTELARTCWARHVLRDTVSDRTEVELLTCCLRGSSVVDETVHVARVSTPAR